MALQRIGMLKPVMFASGASLRWVAKLCEAAVRNFVPEQQAGVLAGAC